MRLSVRLLGLGFALAAPPLAAQGGAPAAATPAGEIAYQTFTLPNGLRVIYSEDHSDPIVSVDVWYNSGSRNERPGRSGFAHLFEHMMFQGSAHVKKSEHGQLITRAGGDDNGSTTEDRTNYYETVPSNRLNLALWLEADRMRSLAITDSNFHNQRETVKEERRLRVDNQPYSPAIIDGMAWPYDTATCYAYAHTVIGSMDDLNAATTADVKAYHDIYYAPNNATLVVVGDFTPAHLKALVGQYFAGVPRQPDPPPVTCDYKISPGARHRDVTDPHANLPAALRFYRIPPHADRDTPALDLLNVILGQGESSRLNVAVVRNAKAAVAVQAFANPFGPRRGPGVLVIFGIVNQGVAVEHLDSLIGMQIDSIRSSGVTPEELTKAKNTFRAGFIQDRETTLSKAEDLHHYDMFHDSLAEINTDLDRYLSVTADDIRRVANKYLDPANALTVIVRPAATPSGGAQ
ncbi:MAG TPA: pitrilysin family protein [Gemmatimonadales bacterium]|nr:pitrilysin family protein [Gemmatimonadales bacterium]